MARVDPSIVWWASIGSIVAITGCPSDPPADDAGRLDAPGLVDAASPDDDAITFDAPGLDAPGLDAFRVMDDAYTPDTSACTPLEVPSGPIVNVDPSMAAALPAMVRDAPEGTTFVLADGTYRMSGDESSRRIRIRAPGITIRSASGDASRVVIDGERTTLESITVEAPGATIAEITITRAVDHGIHVVPPDGGDDVTGFTLYRARLLDCGEQFLKVNPSGVRDAFTDDGTVTCSHFEMTDDGRPHVERATGGCYTGGIDVHSSRGWYVARNRFEGIYCAGEGLAEHAIHFWVGSRDTLVEQNVIVDCARGIGFGLVESGATRMYEDDPYPGLFVGHYDGVIRNNVIVATLAFYDTGIELAQARGTRVLHNTILETPGATGSFSSIDTRFESSSTVVRNNLVRRITVRSGTSTQDHNLENVPLSYFVDGAGGDAHLTESASGAIDRGVTDDDAGLDLDGQTHDRGAAPDLGADER
ncbi:MAG: hypothetical protein J0L92_04700 [Deltaproteobacteria bacterium]|nr:hypothetical protein [Deltaproteobacteria bacterium]